MMANAFFVTVADSSCKHLTYDNMIVRTRFGFVCNVFNVIVNESSQK